MSSKQVSISDHLELNWTHQNITSSSSDQTIIVQSSSSNPPRSSTNMKQRSSLQTQQQQQQPAAETLKCPRCESSNTKFCYYNNYNKTQPRHYCKACKRHWTKGGTLRNVPVGGGRKKKRSKRPAAAPYNTTQLLSTATIISDDHHNINNLGFDQKYIFPTTIENKGGGLLFKPAANRSEFDHQVSTWDFNGGSFAMQQQQSSSHNNQNLGFSIHSSLTSSIIMDTSTTIIPTSGCYSPLLSAAGFKDHDSSTTVTTARMMTPPNSSNLLFSSQPWPMQLVPTPSSNILEPNNFWTWNDIDYMVQGDHINKPFEDPHMKH